MHARSIFMSTSDRPSRHILTLAKSQQMPRSGRERCHSLNKHRPIFMLLYVQPVWSPQYKTVLLKVPWSAIVVILTIMHLVDDTKIHIEKAFEGNMLNQIHSSGYGLWACHNNDLWLRSWSLTQDCEMILQGNITKKRMTHMHHSWRLWPWKARSMVLNPKSMFEEAPSNATLKTHKFVMSYQWRVDPRFSPYRWRTREPNQT